MAYKSKKRWSVLKAYLFILGVLNLSACAAFVFKGDLDWASFAGVMGVALLYGSFKLS